MNASTLILLPIMLQMLLTMGLVVWLGYAKVQALKTKQVKLEEVTIRSLGWPDNVQKIANNFNNQFQLPVLFYILCLLALWRGNTDFSFVILAWCFVFFRVAHSIIHTGYNTVSHRFYAYLGSLITVFLMWCYIVLKIWFSV